MKNSCGAQHRGRNIFPWLGVLALGLCCAGPAFPEKPQAIADIFAQNADSVVVVAVKNKGEWRAQSGSGFIASQDGVIVTDYHLVRRAKKVLVKLHNRKSYKSARLVGADAAKDIALIKIDAAGLKKVSFGDSQNVRVGEQVVSIGNPLGLEASVSDGLISGVREIAPGFKVFQISVPLSHGSSGGPVLNLKGEVIGVATASQDGGQNLNFAVPSDYVKALLDDTERSKNQQFAPAKNFKIYIVKPKDTLYSISKRSHVTVETLVDLNRLKRPHISVGQRLLVPAF